MENVPRLKAACKAAGVEMCALAPYTATTDPKGFVLMARAAARPGVKPVRLMAPW